MNHDEMVEELTKRGVEDITTLMVMIGAHAVHLHKTGKLGPFTPDGRGLTYEEAHKAELAAMRTGHA